MLNRKRKAPAISSSSRFVACPVCGATVAVILINEHLDSAACRTGQSGVAAGQTPRADSGAAAASSQPAEPTTPQNLGFGANSPEALSKAEATCAASPRERAAAHGEARTACNAIVNSAARNAHASSGTAQLNEEQQAATAPAAPERHKSSPAADSLELAEAAQPLPSLASVLSGPPPLVFLRRADGTKVALSDAQLMDEAPCELIRNALPPALARELLQDMLRDADGWKQPVWHIFGQRHLAPRKSAYFDLASSQGSGDAKSLADCTNADNAADVSVNVERRGAPAGLERAAEIASAHVNRLATTGGGRPLDALDSQGWHASYCFTNLYRNGHDTSGAHADRLTLLGTRPIIASLSLGASRLFRVRRAVAAAEKAENKAAGVPPASLVHGGKLKGKPKQSQPCVDITLPHNSLLIMWPPCQEAWKHEVPRMASVAPHPMSGPARVNLTFRRLKPQFERHVPRCRCDKRAILKAAYPKGEDAHLGVREVSAQQKYYFACDNTQSMGCGFFQAFLPPANME